MTLEEGRKGASLFTLAAKKILGESMLMTALYGSAIRGDFSQETSDINLIIIASALTLPVYEELASPVQNAKEDYRLTPIFIEKKELPLFALHYPIRYIDILSCYEVICGDDLLSKFRPDRTIIKERAFHELLDIKLEMRRSLLNSLPNAFMLARSQRTFLPKVICIVRVLIATAHLLRDKEGETCVQSLSELKKALSSESLDELTHIYISLFSLLDSLLLSLQP
jgi:hypothetical protein